MKSTYVFHLINFIVIMHKLVKADICHGQGENKFRNGQRTLMSVTDNRILIYILPLMDVKII